MTHKTVKTGNLYEIVEGSVSGHCCFEFSIMKIFWREKEYGGSDTTFCACECFDIKDAELIFNALEFYEC